MHGGETLRLKWKEKIFLGKPAKLCTSRVRVGFRHNTCAGLPGLWLDPLKKLRELEQLSDENMVNIQRANLLDSSSPNPSVETLLHAFLPHKYIDHTHATPFLILANLPNATEVCKDIFGEKLGIVPYIMPGFALAKKAAEVFEQNPSVEA